MALKSGWRAIRSLPCWWVATCVGCPLPFFGGLRFETFAEKTSHEPSNCSSNLENLKDAMLTYFNALIDDNFGRALGKPRRKWPDMFGCCFFRMFSQYGRSGDGHKEQRSCKLVRRFELFWGSRWDFHVRCFCFHWVHCYNYNIIWTWMFDICTCASRSPGMCVCI